MQALYTKAHKDLFYDAEEETIGALPRNELGLKLLCEYLENDNNLSDLG